MKTQRFPLLLAALAVISTAGRTLAAEPGVVVGDKTVLTATVKAVDAAKRTVTLVGPEGNTVTVKAGEQVKNFDQIKVGDQVVAEYTESLALYLKKGGGAPEATADVAVERAPAGEKPAIVGGEMIEVKAKVVGIDKSKRTVSLEGPGGNTRTVKVGKDVKAFDDLKVGDDVVARYTEAIAIAVRKP